MVAAVCAWHEHHSRAAAELEQRLEGGETLVVAGPALAETYSVLTRLPAPGRLAPSDAYALLEANFLAAEIATLDGNGYRDLLRQTSDGGVAGGQTYDAVIAACARGASVDTLLTFNERHFKRLAGDGVKIVVPGEGVST